jgi:hypothetical protein
MGMTQAETRCASCHCGAVVIEATLPEGLASATRCDCSFCRRRGAAAVTARAADLKVLQGAEYLTLYSWAPRRRNTIFAASAASIPITSGGRTRPNAV